MHNLTIATLSVRFLVQRPEDEQQVYQLNRRQTHYFSITVTDILNFVANLYFTYAAR